MTELVIHENTKRQLTNLAANPAHALLLLGPDGIGKASVAAKLLSELIGIPLEKLRDHPYTQWVYPTNNTISIDTIRDVQKFVQLKTTGKGSIRRVICLEHADGMTQEAQNALLKVLEEPPTDTVILLTAQHKRALLPTILSRVQLVHVLAPTQEQLEVHFANHNKDAIRKAYFLSGGLPGLMHGILADDQNHPLLLQVTIAKEVLQKTTFERLAMVDSLSKQKESLDALLSALERIAQSGLTQAASTANNRQIKQWHQIQKQVFAAKDALAKNANTKLVLTSMFLNV
jgi:DNA polymerase-3 subunit delta'